MGSYDRPYDDDDGFSPPFDDDDVIEGEVIIDYVRPRARSRTAQRTAAARYPMVYEVRTPTFFDRRMVALRPLLAIPLLLFAIPLTVIILAGLVLGWLCILATRSYPRWLFDGLVAAMTFGARIEAFLLLLTPDFPLPNDTASDVALAWADPPEGRLSSWRIGLWKAAIIIPHALILAAISFAQVVVLAITWVIVLRTRRHPPALFEFSTGVNRWRYRVLGYFASFNDRFPPFTPWAGAGPAESTTVIACAAGGLLAVGVSIGLAIALQTEPPSHSQDVSWDALVQRSTTDEGWRFAAGSQSNPTFVVTLLGAGERDGGAADGFPLESRVVTFLLQYENNTATPELVREGSVLAVATDAAGQTRELQPAWATVDGVILPEPIDAGGSDLIQATFYIPADSRITELRLSPPWHSPAVAFQFR